MRIRQIRFTLTEKSGGFQSRWCAMKLSEGIERYVACKRQGGLLYTATECGLTSFKRKVGDVELNEVTSDDVLIYLSGPRTSPISWRRKHQQLSQFFIFCSDRGHLTTSPMPPVRPMVRQMFVPYIYSREEIRLLLRTTTTSQADRRCLIASQTLRTLLLFLYGTGATRSEALELTISDVNITLGTVLIRKRQAYRSRSIPICKDLQVALKKYLRWRSKISAHKDRLFVKDDGHALVCSSLAPNFRRLRELAGIRRSGGPDNQPRLHDLRYTFAVHRITSWILNDADLNRMLPALAAYMGHAGLWATERYLLMSPERFRKSLNKLSPTHSRNKWRNDSRLMKFLASL
jgi:integrase/recombinase XerD